MQQLRVFVSTIVCAFALGRFAGPSLADTLQSDPSTHSADALVRNTKSSAKTYSESTQSGRNTPASAIITLDGNQFNKERLIELFSEVTLSNSFPHIQVKSVASAEQARLELQYPWIYKYTFHEHGYPQEHVINKWVEPILISTGFPYDLKPFVSPVFKGKPITEYPNWPHVADDNGNPFVTWYWTSRAVGKIDHTSEDLVSEEAKKLIPEVEGVTGLSLKYIPHEQETLNNFGNLRIVLVSDPKAEFWSTLYKRGRDHIIGGHSMNPPTARDFRSQNENSRFDTAIYFSRTAPQQVDGYFFSNEKNEIQTAFCFIWTGHPKSLFTRLIDECLIRSLGLPDVAEDAPTSSVLSRWNEASNVDLGAAPLSEFDRFMIGDLYRKNIMPGMTSQTVKHALRK